MFRNNAHAYFLVRAAVRVRRRGRQLSQRLRLPSPLRKKPVLARFSLLQLLPAGALVDLQPERPMFGAFQRQRLGALMFNQVEVVR